jgi:O-antigen/teichoic acid export membrane protein
LREFLVVLVGRVIAIVLALATLRLSTHFLEPAEYGWLAILQAMQLFANFFLTNPVAQYLNRHLIEWSQDGSLLPRLRLYLGYVIGCAFAAAAIFALWISLHGDVPSSGSALSVGLIFFSVIALGWGPVLGSFLNFLGYRTASVLLTAGSALAGLLLSMGFAWLAPNGVSWFAGTVVSFVVVGAMAWHVLRRRLPRIAELPVEWRVEAGAVMRFSGPLAISAIFVWFLISGYRFEFDLIWGKADLGHAVVGLVIAMQVWAVIEQLALQYLQPYLFRHMTLDGARDGSLACSDFVNILVPLYLGYSGLIALNAGLVYKLLVAEGYRSGIGIFLLAIHIELFRVVSNAFSMAAHVRKDAKPLIRTYALAAIVVAGGIYAVGGNGLGIVAACYVLLAGGAVMLAAMFFFSRRLVPFELDWRRWGAGLAMAAAGSGAGMFMLGKQQEIAVMVAVAMLSAVVFLAYSALVLFRNPALARLLQRPLPSQVQSN